MIADKEEEQFNHFKDNQLLKVDFQTGEITVKRNKKVVGSLNQDGYVRVWCGKYSNGVRDAKLRMAHRLIWFLANGYEGLYENEVDHINSIRDDNRLSNLRLVSQKQNKQYQKNKGKRYTLMPKATVKEVCRLLQNTNLSDDKIADAVNQPRSKVRDIKIRRSWVKISNDYDFSKRGY